MVCKKKKWLNLSKIDIKQTLVPMCFFKQGPKSAIKITLKHIFEHLHARLQSFSFSVIDQAQLFDLGEMKP